jgi:uncharacterized protein YrrD
MHFRENADVLTSGGEKIGRIERIVVDPATEEVTHLLISRGTFSKEKKMIPSMWVRDIFENSVRLSVKNEVIENLPDPESTRRQA